jgi:hypothetical protein
VCSRSADAPGWPHRRTLRRLDRIGAAVFAAPDIDMDVSSSALAGKITVITATTITRWRCREESRVG